MIIIIIFIFGHIFLTSRNWAPQKLIFGKFKYLWLIYVSLSQTEINRFPVNKQVYSQGMGTLKCEEKIIFNTCYLHNNITD